VWLSFLTYDKKVRILRGKKRMFQKKLICYGISGGVKKSVSVEIRLLLRTFSLPHSPVHLSGESAHIKALINKTENYSSLYDHMKFDVH
jgi:hypothetical protein